MNAYQALAEARQLHGLRVYLRSMIRNPESLSRNREECARLRALAHSQIEFLRAEMAYNAR